MKVTFDQLAQDASSGDQDAQYQLALRFCRLNKPHATWFWLDQASNAGHIKAKELLDELVEKGLLQPQYDRYVDQVGQYSLYYAFRDGRV